MNKGLFILNLVCLIVLIKTYGGFNRIIGKGNSKKKVVDTTTKSPSKILFNHHTFNDFIKGKLSDAGGNLCISKNGRLQFINLFDLDADGFPEVVTNNDHNGSDTPDALVYQNNQPNGLRSLTFAFAQDAPVFQNFSNTPVYDGGLIHRWNARRGLHYLLGR